MDLRTWLRPAGPVSARLVLMVQRMALLQAARKFLQRCEQAPRT
jgi:hypothetical protein